MSDAATLTSLTIMVGNEGLSLSYKWSDLPVSGRDFIDDETACDWTDDQIRETAWAYIEAGHIDKDVLEAVTTLEWDIER